MSLLSSSFDFGYEPEPPVASQRENTLKNKLSNTLNPPTYDSFSPNLYAWEKYALEHIQNTIFVRRNSGLLSNAVNTAGSAFYSDALPFSFGISTNQKQQLGDSMARTRMIKPTFYDDEKLAEISIVARYLYIGLWCHFDRSGLIEYGTKFFKKSVFPYDDDMSSSDVEKLIQELISASRLVECEFEGKKFLFCPTFKKHQSFHHFEKARYQYDTSTVQVPNLPRTCPSTSASSSTSASASSSTSWRQGKTPTARSLKLPHTNPVPTVIAVYVEAYKSRFGARPEIDGKTQGVINRLLKTIPANRLCDLIQVYLQIDHPWFREKFYDLVTFENNLNKISTCFQTGTQDPTKSQDWTKFWSEAVS